MSTPDPRDRALEHLLRQQAPPPSAPLSPCPDANTLAAWLDGALTDEEVAAFEAHAAACARCSEAMAVMIRSTEDTPGFATAPAAEVLPRPGAPSTPDKSAPSRHMRVARWLAPLTAAAAATLVWMLAPGEKPDVMEQAPDSLQARRAELDTLDVPPASLPAEPAPSLAAPALTAEAAPTAAPPLAAQQKAAPETTAAADMATAAVPTPAENDLLARQPPAQARAAEALAAPAPAPAPAPGAAPAEAPAMVDTAVLWRLAGARAVERSTDAGATWTRMNTGAAADLIAAASPSANVCWVIAADGQVLRTVDGTTWQAVTRPATEALVSVEAADAQNASVTAASGRTYVTSDGGVTWRPRP